MFSAEYIKNCKEIEQKLAPFLKSTYPRRILPPSHEYGNPRLYATSLASIAYLSTTGYNARNHVVGGVDLCVKQLIKYKVPTFFVHPELLKAVANTDISGDFYFNQLKWPFEAMVFCLPYKMSVEIFGLPVPWLSIARIPKGVYNLGPLTDAEITKDEIGFHYPVFANRHFPTDFGGIYPMDRTLSELINTRPFFTDDFAESIVGKDGLSPEEDKRISDKALKLTVLLVLAMISRPEHIEMGQIVRKCKVNDKNPAKNQDELWSANVIGRGYVLKTDGKTREGCIGATLRSHFRRGHYRRQVFGPRYDIGGNEIAAAEREHKVIWIEPVLVNA